jgi:uncharacterized protein
MKTYRPIQLFIVFCTFCSPLFAADTPRQLQWEDLKQPSKFSLQQEADNPFASLRPEQLQTLMGIAISRDKKARGAEVTETDIASERAAVEKLKSSGIDADALLAKREAMMHKTQELAQSPNKALDGELVRIPGYVLPLEFAGKQVTEFLLVPWVGACVHTPPPPSNQIVHVKTDKPIEVNAMFDAVWVTGRIAVNSSRKQVFITDGTSQIDVGYAISAGKVQRY